MCRTQDRSPSGTTVDGEDGPDTDLPASPHERSASAAPGLSVSASHAGDIAAQPHLVRRCDVHPHAPGLSLSGSDHGLGEPGGSGLAVVEHHRFRLLRRGAGRGAGPVRQAENLQHRSGESVHQFRLHQRAT